jgi:ribosome-binding ATPase YchF (GTP1/OBG family)
VPVPDPRLDALSRSSSREGHADHGRVRRHRRPRQGRGKGEGLGNKFLANIREVDAIAHVVRCFENDDIVHVAGKVDPMADIETIDTELALADLDIRREGAEPRRAAAKAGDKDAIARATCSSRVREALNAGQAGAFAGLDDDERPDRARSCSCSRSSR